MSTTTSDNSIDWTTDDIPTYDELPPFKNFPVCAWGVWGAYDQLGTMNLLTDALVKKSALEEIRTGKTVSLNWPLNFFSSEQPMFGRIPPEIKMFQKMKDGHKYSRDDEIHNSSGTEWDGLRHFPIIEHEMFYNKLCV
ncbi:hypothetical protein DFH07DRAFT_824451, partial [Mycena maculata]